jgi:RHS repeat-associated protein
VPQLKDLTYRYYETSLETQTHRFKRLDYEFDLISGKVNQLWYQRGNPDQFAYQYAYDADNRLVSAQTSTDGYTWVQDAKYNYYKHGPLSRTELGSKLQGVDYAYTLQGWIKGVNAGTLNPQRDMGNDGLNGFLPDVFGYTIGYNSTDYGAIGTTPTSGFEPTNNITTTQGLYNGNIRFTTNQIKGFSAISYVYNYDQLNRLSGMRSKTITNHDWSLNVATDHNYEETVTYDANGNIRTYWRNEETGVRMDQLKYHYDATKKNRLLSVNDAADPSAFADDVEGTETFAYDAIGNLTQHNKPSGNTALTWNAYGKVRQVTTSTATMTFGYDAQQNRLRKTVTTSSGTKTTYYIRDAQGNALAVYEQNGASLVWKEQDLYGSSRLGMAKPEREVTGFFWASATYTLVAGAKSYELSNHLGNVMAVISDRGELQSAQDFYPFGMAMPGRSTDAKHRYGFNGKETDPETGIQDYGMRWYLPNIARFPSIDPLTQKYPWYTPYQFAGNKPIVAIDLDGAEEAPKVKATTVATFSVYGQRDGKQVELTGRSKYGLHQLTFANGQTVVSLKSDMDVNTDVISTSTKVVTLTKAEAKNHQKQLAYEGQAANHLLNPLDPSNSNLFAIPKPTGEGKEGSIGLELQGRGVTWRFGYCCQSKP